MDEVTVSDMDADHTWPASRKFIERTPVPFCMILDRMVKESTDPRLEAHGSAEPATAAEPARSPDYARSQRKIASRGAVAARHIAKAMSLIRVQNSSIMKRMDRCRDKEDALRIRGMAQEITRNQRNRDETAEIRRPLAKMSGF